MGVLTRWRILDGELGHHISPTGLSFPGASPAAVAAPHCVVQGPGGENPVRARLAARYSRAVRVGVLASGSGTLLEAMLAAELPVVVVIADRPCRALDLTGRRAPAVLVERDTFGTEFDRDAYTRLVVESLDDHDVELVVSAGFGTVLGQDLQDAFGGRILNTHPSLLPAFPGWHAVPAALDFGVKVTGCTVHVMTLDVDAGPILAQEAVPVLDTDDETTLHERIKVVERRLYIDTIGAIIERGYVLEPPGPEDPAPDPVEQS
ncbi:MAG: phosphoribosylglycinamide formyltransferase [Actinomycetia bacterium]|nr:phosphoribosylglycinamide formyltransferase [Actinomycetes bacterium]